MKIFKTIITACLLLTVFSCKKDKGNPVLAQKTDIFPDEQSQDKEYHILIQKLRK